MEYYRALNKNRADRYILTWKDSQKTLLIQKADGRLMAEVGGGPGAG